MFRIKNNENKRLVAIGALQFLRIANFYIFHLRYNKLFYAFNCLERTFMRHFSIKAMKVPISFFVKSSKYNKILFALLNKFRVSYKSTISVIAVTNRVIVHFVTRVETRRRLYVKVSNTNFSFVK